MTEFASHHSFLHSEERQVRFPPGLSKKCVDALSISSKKFPDNMDQRDNYTSGLDEAIIKGLAASASYARNKANSSGTSSSLLNWSKSGQLKEIKQDCRAVTKDTNSRKEKIDLPFSNRKTAENIHPSATHSRPLVDKLVNDYGHLEENLSTPRNKYSMPNFTELFDQVPMSETLPFMTTASPPPIHVNSALCSDASSSQKTVAFEESSSHPSFCEEDGNSNEEKYLNLNFSNPEPKPSPENRVSPYHVDMEPDMFRAVKDGPDDEYLRVDVVRNIGSRRLESGGFSFGWIISVQKIKRKLDFGKSLDSPKKSDSSCPGSRDTKSNRSLKVPLDTKEMKSTLHSKHVNEDKIAKTSKTSCDLPTEAKKSTNATKNDKSYGFEKSPMTVPSSGRKDVLKTDGLGKNNTVIDESTMGFISSKKERSAVYSGKKSTLEVQPLKRLCFEVVQKNILSLKIGQNVPFELLKPALKLCNPSKLHKIEESNRHILKHTGSLWKKFLEAEFRGVKCLNGESHKDAFWRARNLREEKLKRLSASISNAKSKVHPERQTKWVNVGANNPERRQKRKLEEVSEQIPIPRIEVNGKSCSSHREPPPKKRSESESSSPSSPDLSQKPCSQAKSKKMKAAKKPTAPLMLKTKRTMMSLVRRR